MAEKCPKNNPDKYLRNGPIAHPEPFPAPQDGADSCTGPNQLSLTGLLQGVDGTHPGLEEGVGVFAPGATHTTTLRAVALLWR